MKYIYSIMLFVGVVLITSCLDKKDEYDDIPGSQRLKYNIGDTLIYKSNLNDADTFIVYDISAGYYDSEKTYHWEYQRTYFTLNDTSDLPSLYLKRHVFEQTKSKVSISWLTFSSKIIFNDGILKTLEISNNVFNTYEMIPDGFSYEENNITKVYYNFKYGVMRYDFNTGEIFELQIPE